jgi:hypothetical protein
MVSAVEACEAAGFDSAWQAEDVYGPDAIVPLACYAQITERMRLGTCVTNPNTRSAAIPAASYIKKFRPEFEEYIRSGMKSEAPQLVGAH